jgi:nitronate monooxygenase
MNNEFCQQSGIRYPIIQAPMAGVSTPELAAAVSNAGALGSIAIGASRCEQARTMIRATRQLTNQPFNVNVFCHQPAVTQPEVERQWLAHLAPFFARFAASAPTALQEIYLSFLVATDVQQMLLEEKPAVVSFHFGVPGKSIVSTMQQAGIYTLACVTNTDELQHAEAAGVDAIVAQGIEAGGHRGVFNPKQPDSQLDTLTLLQRLKSQTTKPLIAAGGIMHGEDIAQMLAAGASAVQLGTAFILCPESAANALYRAKLKSPLAQQTRFTSAISGRPARGLTNSFYQEVELNAPPLPDYPIAYDAAKALVAAAVKQGSEDFTVQWAGQAAALARELPAATLIATLVKEWQQAQCSGS